MIYITQRIIEINGFEYDCAYRGWGTIFDDYVNIDTSLSFEDLTDISTLVLSGGNDHKDRTKQELTLIKRCIEKNIPILGICRGAFILTEILGGNTSDINNHMNTSHYVYTNDSKKHKVNSYHGIGITSAPLNSDVLATDGKYIESWILGNIAAIVWHPEREPNSFIPDEIRQIIKFKSQTL